MSIYYDGKNEIVKKVLGNKVVTIDVEKFLQTQLNLTPLNNFLNEEEYRPDIEHICCALNWADINYKENKVDFTIEDALILRQHLLKYKESRGNKLTPREENAIFFLFCEFSKLMEVKP